MDASFWHARWQQNELGFQLEAAHPLLQKWLAHVGSGKGPVLVPLCGKSPDIQYLANFSSVVGAELSPIACRKTERSPKPKLVILTAFKVMLLLYGKEIFSR